VPNDSGCHISSWARHWCRRLSGSHRGRRARPFSAGAHA
jgi:hypothetical protein